MAQEIVKVKWPLSFLPPVHLRLPEYWYEEDPTTEEEARARRGSITSYDSCSDDVDRTEAWASSKKRVERDEFDWLPIPFGSEQSLSSQDSSLIGGSSMGSLPSLEATTCSSSWLTELEANKQTQPLKYMVNDLYQNGNVDNIFDSFEPEGRDNCKYTGKRLRVKSQLDFSQVFTSRGITYPQPLASSYQLYSQAGHLPHHQIGNALVAIETTKF
eukprot:274368-Prorocentrum_minimum.AAC.1